MLTVSNLGIQFNSKKLFENVNLQFQPGNCYGVIGANGAGKSTFLRILSNEIASTTGEVTMPKNFRMAVLKQNQNEFDEMTVIDTVLEGHSKLAAVKKEMDELYAKEDFSDEDGERVSILSGEFEEMDGWSSESNAAMLLNGLGITTELHAKYMRELKGDEKVKVLLAQALFGNPDILVLDEPTNNLDIKAIRWLENFLINFDNTIIVVSHDRHFLNRVCTHICDVDYGKIKIYPGNYDFWVQSSALAKTLMEGENRRKEEKIKELKDFIARFSANASKSKQATSRKKSLDKISLDDIGVSNRKYPYINFDKTREVGNDILTVTGLSKTVDGVKVLDNLSFVVDKGEKVAFLSENDIALTTLFKILNGELEPDEGTYEFGITVTTGYLPRDNSEFFTDPNVTIIDWLRNFSPEDQTDPFIRSFLGRMLFSGEDALKKTKILSGGEKVRCMLSKMMLQKANLVMLDDPTNHLDLESITSLNDSLIKYDSNVLFASKDQEFLASIATRVIQLNPGGYIDRKMTFEEFIDDENIQKLVKEQSEIK
jgi:ATPase subunit of ABC transporter with duplicated ATPase domains